jgi:hypothetical protein
VSGRFRVCAVCGKRHGPTYGFKTTLRRIGIMEGDKAVSRPMTNPAQIKQFVLAGHAERTAGE